MIQSTGGGGAPSGDARERRGDLFIKHAEFFINNDEIVFTMGLH